MGSKIKRVLDITDERGLLTGRLLADLGADVVQVEPPDGSKARAHAPLAGDGHSYYWATFGAGRRSVVLDLDTDAGRADFLDLAACADFVIESAGAGVMAARGLGWPVLHRRNPWLVHVTITAFGHDGPKAGLAASDLTVWAAGGPLEPNRDGDRPPLRISVPQAFLSAAADAAGGALLAHRERLRTGQGQSVDVSAQAVLGLNTLGRVLAEPIGDAHPEWGALNAGPKRPDQSGSGTGTDSRLKKWRCADGLVEFHLAMGAAVGRFTNNFFRWLAAETDCDERITGWDWRTVPSAVEDGTFTWELMTEIREAVAAFLAGKTKQEILAASMQYQLLCAGIADTADLLDSPQFAERGYLGKVGTVEMPTTWAQFSHPMLVAPRPAPGLGEHDAEVRAQWRATASPRHAHVVPVGVSPRPVLDGLKVADFSWVVAGPVMGRALADFGATVVRVESSRRVETARLMQPFYGGTSGPENSGLYGTCNAGKLGVSLDLSTEAGRAVAADLIDWADVVVESFAPGQMARWGLDYASVRPRRPDLVMISTSLMGQSGPHAKLAGYGNIGAALSGFQDLVGWPDAAPIGPFGPYTDYVAPRFGLVALLAALDVHDRTGAGRYIDLSQIEAGVFLLSPQLARCADSGIVARRLGNADEAYAPHGVYPCLRTDERQRFVAVAVTSDAEWTALVRVVDRPDLAADVELRTPAGRLARAAEVDAALAAWVAEHGVGDAERLLQAAGVPAHRAATSADWAADEQLGHRGHLRALPHPVFGTAYVEGPRYELSTTPAVVDRPAPAVGQDNDQVLRVLLGYDDASVARCVSAGALV